MKKICNRCGNQATGSYIDATGFCFTCNVNFPRECKKSEERGEEKQ